MSYCTLQNLIDRYGTDLITQLTDRDDPPTGAIVQAVVTAAQLDADAIIDAYLATRYALPLSSDQPVLRPIAEAITFYKLFRREADPKTVADHDDARKQLLAISNGTMKLAAAGITPVGASGDLPVSNDTYRPLSSSMPGMI